MKEVVEETYRTVTRHGTTTLSSSKKALDIVYSAHVNENCFSTVHFVYSGSSLKGHCLERPPL